MTRILLTVLATGLLSLPAFAQDKDKPLALELEPRSAYQLNGASRWRWQHSIPPTPELRYSITFRTLRKS